MTRYVLKDITVSRLGFTTVFQYTQADLTAQTTNNTQFALVLSALNLGDVVDNFMVLEVITPSVGLATCTVSVGVTGALTQFIAASDNTSAGNLYFCPANTVAPYPTIATGKNLVANFTPGSSEPLSNCTALTGRVWATISRATDRQTIQF